MCEIWREIAPPTRSDSIVTREAGSPNGGASSTDPLAINDQLTREVFQIDPSFVQLNLDWLDVYTRDKLLRQSPFVQSDWHKLVNAIFDNFDGYSPRVLGRKWYTAMASLMIDRFPHLFVGMTTMEALDFVKKKLRTKFKNGRYRVAHKL